jgi:hypothetical protein
VAERKTGSNAVLANVISNFGSNAVSVNMDYPSLGTAFVLGTSKMGTVADGGDGHIMGGGGTGTYITTRKNVRMIGKYLGVEFSSSDDYDFRSIAFGIQATGRDC